MDEKIHYLKVLYLWNEQKYLITFAAGTVALEISSTLLKFMTSGMTSPLKITQCH